MHPASSAATQKVISHQALSHDAIADFDEAIVVAGSRSITDYAKFKSILEDYICIEFPRAKIIFITGEAPSGPDDMIIRWCRENGYAWTGYPADWDDISAPGSFVKRNKRGNLYNAVAGHQRNRAMAEAATSVIVFWDGKSPGTRNMIAEAERCQITPKVFILDGEKDTSHVGQESGQTPSGRRIYPEVH
jgi:hypothetical protein